jgi:hypothetical protein
MTAPELGCQDKYDIPAQSTWKYASNGAKGPLFLYVASQADLIAKLNVQSMQMHREAMNPVSDVSLVPAWVGRRFIAECIVRRHWILRFGGYPVLRALKLSRQLLAEKVQDCNNASSTFNAGSARAYSRELRLS